MRLLKRLKYVIELKVLMGMAKWKIRNINNFLLSCLLLSLSSFPLSSLVIAFHFTFTSSIYTLSTVYCQKMCLAN